MHERLVAWPRLQKQLSVIALDVGLALLSTWLAFSLRLDTLHWPSGAQWWVYLLAPVLAVPIFVRLGLYRAIFRYTGLAALMAIAKAVALYAVLLLVRVDTALKSVKLRRLQIQRIALKNATIGE